MKRYAIVRVDNNCPFITEDMEHKVCEKVFNCKEFWEDEPCSKTCRYGDTKEQLIAKVETAIRRLQADKNRIIVGYDMWAKFIVEFLGVEE